MYPQGGISRKKKERKNLERRGVVSQNAKKAPPNSGAPHRIQYLLHCSGVLLRALQDARAVWRISLHTVAAHLLCVSPATTTMLVI